LKQAGVRAEIDARNEKINYKVREHSLQKVPVLFVVGAREAQNGTVAIRRMDEPAQPVEKLEDAVWALAKAAAAPY
ncbi:MAG TPA: His/Gly/Thr/Pro-type tRNA ligase C-terminal domain-containing protein, partial [Alphaproteobacteria bacterium]|nr:His/Gly/Thr/Pro-type tRNA ligase C-terminal domain-containing protein [Alphaproteobacteria bacterium]